MTEIDKDIILKETYKHMESTYILFYYPGGQAIEICRKLNVMDYVIPCIYSSSDKQVYRDVTIDKINDAYSLHYLGDIRSIERFNYYLEYYYY